MFKDQQTYCSSATHISVTSRQQLQHLIADLFESAAAEAAAEAAEAAKTAAEAVD